MHIIAVLNSNFPGSSHKLNVFFMIASLTFLAETTTVDLGRRLSLSANLLGTSEPGIHDTCTLFPFLWYTCIEVDHFI